MGHPYLPKAADLQSARFQKFLKEFTLYETACHTQAAQDRFLDAYSLWMRHRSPITYENLYEAVALLRQLDPAFRFPLPHDGATADA